MKKLYLSLLFALAVLMSVASQWQPDILGDGYEMRYVDQPDDYQGKVR